MISNPIPWPNGCKCACAISFDMDADSIIHVADRGSSFKKLYLITQGRYGPLVAVPRILESYRRLGIKQTFFVPAWCIEQYAQIVDMILKDGHEIGHHSYIHEESSMITEEEFLALFHRSLEIHKKYCGRSPVGYRSPVYNI